MAEQRERIVYEIDSRSVKAFKEQADKWLADSEAKAKAAGEGIAGATEKTATHIAGVTQRSASAINRIVANAEKAARDLGATATERIESRRIFDLGKVAGDPNAISRVNAAYDTLIQKQKLLGDGAERTGKVMNDNLATFAKSVVSIAALKKVIEVAAIDTGLYAARVQTMGVALNAAARSNHIAVLEMEKQEKAVKQLGITTLGARQGLLRMTTAQLDVAKATELARLAQNAAVISGENSTESFNRLIYAIQSGQPEMLRTIGINVTFEKEYARLARTLKIQTEELSENQKVQARLNAVLRAAPLFAGIYEDSLGTVGKQLTSLRRHFEEAQNAVGQQFLPAIGAAITKLTELAQLIQRHPELGLVATAGAGIAGAAIGGGLIGGQLGGPAGAAIGAKIGVVVGGLTTLVALLPEIQRRWQDFQEAVNSSLPAFLQNMPRGGYGGTAASAADTIGRDAAIARAKQINAVTAPLLKEADRISTEIENRREKERIRSEEWAKKQAAAEKHLRGVLLDALKDEEEGTAKILARRRELIIEYGLTVRALQQIDKITESIADKENKRLTKELDKFQRETFDDRLKKELDITEARSKSQADFYRDTARDSETIFVASKQREIQAEEAAGRARLASIDAVNRLDVQSQLQIEQQKAQIQEETMLKVFKLKMSLLDAQTKNEVAQMEVVARAAGIKEEMIEARRNTIIKTRAEQTASIETETQARIDEVRENAARRQTQIVIDANQRAFERLRDSAEGVFDAILTRSKSFGEALADAIKLPLLTMFKNILSTQTALLLMRVFGGGGMAGAGAGNSAGGLLGRLAGFGAFGQMAMGGGGGMFGIPGAPGGTPGFAGPVGGFAGLPLFGMGGMKAAGLGGGLGAGASLGLPFLGAAALGGFGAFKLGQKGGMLGGIGGPALGAVSGLLGFGALSSMFPALIAAGPVGWIAAAGIGATIGLMGVLRKSAEGKVKEKVKSLYGVTIAESNILKQISGIAKEQFGGNIDLAIRAPIVRDLVQLYKMTMTGTGTGFSAAPSPFFAGQSGGQIYTAPGSPALTAPYTSPATAPTVVTQIHVVGAKDFFQNETVNVISQNGRAVQQASISAQKSNSGRTQATRLSLAPNSIVTP